MDTLDRIAALADDDRTARIALTLGCQAGDNLAYLAVARHGAIQTLHYILTGPKPGETLPMRAWRHAIAQRLNPDKIEVVLEQTRELGLEVVIPSDPGWPIPRSDTAPVPLALWTQGDATLLAAPHTSRCAVVGSRAGTDYGTKVTHDLASGLAQQGVTVVSGGWHAIWHRSATSGSGPWRARRGDPGRRPRPILPCQQCRPVRPGRPRGWGPGQCRPTWPTRRAHPVLDAQPTHRGAVRGRDRHRGEPPLTRPGHRPPRRPDRPPRGSRARPGHQPCQRRSQQPPTRTRRARDHPLRRRRRTAHGQNPDHSLVPPRA